MRLFLFSILLILATSCGYRERSHPEKFLKVISEPWRGESLLDLEIINTAKHTDYENINIHITYFEHGRNVGSEGITHWGIIEAESNSILKVNIHPPRPPVHPDEIRFIITAHVVNH
jgi:hypothetical protein